MRTRLAILTAVALVMLLVGALVPVVFPQPSKVTRANFECIERGMTLAEVEAILGGPPGDYRTGPTVVVPTGGPGYTLALTLDDTWSGDDIHLSVGFSGGRVEEITFLHMMPEPIGAWELLRWRLASRWERLTGTK